MVAHPFHCFPLSFCWLTPSSFTLRMRIEDEPCLRGRSGAKLKSGKLFRKLILFYHQRKKFERFQKLLSHCFWRNPYETFNFFLRFLQNIHPVVQLVIFKIISLILLEKYARPIAISTNLSRNRNYLSVSFSLARFPQI